MPGRQANQGLVYTLSRAALFRSLADPASPAIVQHPAAGRACGIASRGYWRRHEHMGCARMYVTMAPNELKCIVIPSGMVMVMLPPGLRS